MSKHISEVQSATLAGSSSVSEALWSTGLDKQCCILDEISGSVRDDNSCHKVFNGLKASAGAVPENGSQRCDFRLVR